MGVCVGVCTCARLREPARARVFERESRSLFAVDRFFDFLEDFRVRGVQDLAVVDLAIGGDVIALPEVSEHLNLLLPLVLEIHEFRCVAALQLDRRHLVWKDLVRRIRARVLLLACLWRLPAQPGLVVGIVAVKLVRGYLVSQRGRVAGWILLLQLLVELLRGRLLAELLRLQEMRDPLRLLLIAYVICVKVDVVGALRALQTIDPVVALVLVLQRVGLVSAGRRWLDELVLLVDIQEVGPDLLAVDEEIDVVVDLDV